MNPDPINPSIMQDFRDAIGVSSSPSFFDSSTPLTPVAIVGGNVGFPKPRNNQKFKYATLRCTTSQTAYQIATASATTRIYFIGVLSSNNAAVSSNIVIFDGISGTGPTIPQGSVLTEEAGNVSNFYSGSTINSLSTFIPYPVQMKQGLRATTGGLSQDCTFTVYYLEEQI